MHPVLYNYLCGIHLCAAVIQTIFLPNGMRARRAILKCCKPKGIPMIVMQQKRPKVK